MSRNVLRNPTFTCHVQANRFRNMDEFCDGWFVEYGGGSAFRIGPAPSLSANHGLQLGLSAPSAWFRIWQPVTLDGREKAGHFRLQLRARASQGDRPRLLLDWISLLTLNADGKRVHARKLFSGPHAFTGRWDTLSMDVAPGALAEGSEYVFAIQFSEGPGVVEIESVQLTRRSGSAAPDRGAAPGPAPGPAPDVAARPASLAAPPAGKERPAFRPTLVPPVPVRADARRVAVVSWDMGHNPVGRAFLLADMAAGKARAELIGPMFPAYGREIWSPIADARMTMHAFPAPTMRAFLEGAKAAAQRVTCDLVYVSKPRFPSLFLGALIKHANKCPMVVDVDDHELGFFKNRAPASLAELEAAITADPALLDTPYTEIWTRYAETLIPECDGVTVSNHALRERFGGMVVRHGRNEQVFERRHYDRRAVRAEFGYGDADRVILFLGTPRPHKGIFEVADALEQLGDDRLALCIIGSIDDRRVSSRFSQYRKARISLHPNQSWEKLPALVAMADAVFLLQDGGSAISSYQIPAKLTDALALGIPIYAKPVPPLRDLIAAGAVNAIEDAEALKRALRTLADEGFDEAAAERRRDYFLSELSYTVNAARLALAFDKAKRTARQDVPAFDRLFAAIEKATAVPLPRIARRWSAPAVWKNAKPDVVFLWKQNDSDIYGRRSDMVAKYLLRSGAVGRIIHFDAPISANDLDNQARHDHAAVAHQGNFVYLNTVRRVLRQADTPRLLRRTFLFRTEGAPRRYMGVDLPPRDAYADFVRRSLKEAGIGEAPILWTCPVVFDYAAVRSAVRPSCVVADIIDDQRCFQAQEKHRQRVAQAYDEILGDADLVFTNCETVRRGFAATRADIHVVPNGAELHDLGQPWPVPEDIAELPRPLLGYVGNLRDRVDLDLIAKVADRFASASIVLIGSAHDRPEVLELAKRPNIHILGVKPYEVVARYIRAFDVAMVPHLRNTLSESMNPLKLYVYFALGVPIVTTDVANIGDIGPYSAVATSHDSFLKGVEEALAGRAKRATEGQRALILRTVSWEARVRELLGHLGLEPAMNQAWHDNRPRLVSDAAG